MRFICHSRRATALPHKSRTSLGATVLLPLGGLVIPGFIIMQGHKKSKRKILLLIK